MAQPIPGWNSRLAHLEFPPGIRSLKGAAAGIPAPIPILSLLPVFPAPPPRSRGSPAVRESREKLWDRGRDLGSALPDDSMAIPSGILLACSLFLLPGFGNSFNVDTERPRIIPGSRESFFGYTVQQHDIGGKKWLVVGAPYESNGHQKTGDVYKCPVPSDGNCTKLNLGRVTLSNVSERKDNMRLGLSLATDPRDSSVL
ncbi:integrin alpha-11-like, partial [Cyanistes caeruleus]|uniref:integrin alpha-11-like n=1 Tax=Cyanistes caeruleus TaxID=156563 RepID=UPI000CDA2D46